MKTTIKAFLETILQAVVSFAGCKIFDMIAGTGTWESNPWVFVYEFEIVK